MRRLCLSKDQIKGTRKMGATREGKSRKAGSQGLGSGVSFTEQGSI